MSEPTAQRISEIISEIRKLPDRNIDYQPYYPLLKYAKDAADALESLQREREQWNKRKTYLGIDENRLLLVAQLLQQHGLTPEDVKLAANNFAAASEIAIKIITGTFDEAMKQKFPATEPKGEATT